MINACHIWQPNIDKRRDLNNKNKLHMPDERISCMSFKFIIYFILTKLCSLRENQGSLRIYWYKIKLKLNCLFYLFR